MGQHIEVESTRVVNDSVMVTTNRSFTGADGEGFTSQDEAADIDTFGAKLSIDLFESDDEISRVHVASNVVVVTRNGGWSDEGTDGISKVITDFFLFY
ncbi:MAG: hypothetical protein E2O95_02750 [Acidobacteria bacterium]|nr:MAG: hypothetical protein E2O95_02750 [Acidobacteriota bacterium]